MILNTVYFYLPSMASASDSLRVPTEVVVVMDHHGVMFQQVHFGPLVQPRFPSLPFSKIQNFPLSPCFQALNSFPGVGAVLLSGGTMDILDLQTNAITLKNSICNSLLQIHKKGVPPFILPIFERTDLKFTEKNKKTTTEKNKKTATRDPDIYTKICDFLSQELAVFGEQHLGYNPVIPIPFQLQIDKDKKYLSFISYSNVALMASLYIHRVVKTPPLRRTTVRDSVIHYYNNQLLSSRYFRQGRWIGGRYAPDLWDTVKEKLD